LSAEQGVDLFEVCDSRRRRIFGKAVIAVKQSRIDSGGHCPFDVFSQTVTDMPGLSPLNRVMIQRGLKDRRVGFGGAGASRDVNGIEEVI
jgi:hypothetical protein